MFCGQMKRALQLNYHLANKVIGYYLLLNSLHILHLGLFGIGATSDAKSLLVFVATDVKINQKYYEEYIL